MNKIKKRSSLLPNYVKHVDVWRGMLEFFDGNELQCEEGIMICDLSNDDRALLGKITNPPLIIKPVARRLIEVTSDILPIQ